MSASSPYIYSHDPPWAGLRLAFLGTLALWASVFLGCEDHPLYGISDVSLFTPVAQRNIESRCDTSGPCGVDYTSSLSTTHPTTVAARSTQREWPLKSLAILEPLVWEVSGLVMLQYVGLPIIAKAVMTARRLHGNIRPSVWMRCLRLFRLKLPSIIRNQLNKGRIRSTHHWTRRLKASFIRLYRKRSRLSVASEYTNFVNEQKEDTASS